MLQSRAEAVFNQKAGWSGMAGDADVGLNISPSL